MDCALQISLSWNKSFQSGGIARLAWIMFWPHVALPHAAVAALSLALFLVIKFRCFNSIFPNVKYFRNLLLRQTPLLYDVVQHVIF